MKESKARTVNGKTLCQILFFSLGPLIVFSAYLIIQHAMVFLQHDDWGISVLHYTIKIDGFEGQDFTLAQSVRFLTELYNNWSGRVTSIFLHIYLQKAGLWVVRLVQVGAIIAVVLLSYCITIQTLQIKHNAFLLGLSICLYLAIPAQTLVTGIYWFSAASGYLWGMPIFLLGVYLSTLWHGPSVLTYLLFAFAATFHELMGIAIFVYLAVSLFLIDKAHLRKTVIYSLFPTLLALATIFAPGNFARRSVSEYSSNNIIDIVASNLTGISDKLFTLNGITLNNLFFAIMSVSLLIMLYTILSKRLSLAQSVIALIITISTLTIIYTCIAPAVFVVLFLFAYAIGLAYTCKNKKCNPFLPLYFAGASTMLPLLLTPGVASRAVLPFMLLMFIPILYSFSLLQTKMLYPMQKALIVLLACFAILNSLAISLGYSKNYPVFVANDAILKMARSISTSNTGALAEVVLLKIPAPNYAERMPYERPIIETWIKQYYSLPESTKLKWLGNFE